MVVTPEGSRATLAAISIGGEFVRTPGHSGDGVSLVLDGGAAFTGDLPLPAMATAEHAGRDPSQLTASPS